MKKLKSNSGLTLAEMLVVVLLLGIVVGFIAGGIPTVLRLFNRITDNGDAQVLLSTTTTCLRDELTTAKDISTEGTKINYTNQYGDNCYISLDTNNTSLSGEGIYLNYVGGSSYSRLLVSREAASRSLHTSYTSVSYSSGIITFTGLKVYRGSTELSGLDTYKVMVIGG